MADNIQVTQGTGTTMATDDVAGVQYPRVKISHGADGSAVDASNTNPLPVAGPLTDAQLRASTVPVSGTVTANTGLAQPLTDAQLRASTVPVSGTITANTGLAQPLTDTQLRASAVPVSGTITANTGLVQPLTDAELRASAVPVSGPLTDAQLTAAALATEVTAQSIRDRLPSVFQTPNLLAIDSLGTPQVSRVQATTGTAANIALTSTCRRVSMFATQGAWYSISGTATATSHYVGTGERIDFDVPASTTISVLQETVAGSIRITELL